jgi:Flp pilus assembly pilin Flp
VLHYDCVQLRRLLGNQWNELEGKMLGFVRRIWTQDEGQDIAEYAVMLAVILVLVVGTVRLIGSNANNVFSNVASSVQ